MASGRPAAHSWIPPSPDKRKYGSTEWRSRLPSRSLRSALTAIAYCRAIPAIGCRLQTQTTLLEQSHLQPGSGTYTKSRTLPARIFVPFGRKMQRCATSLFLCEKRNKDLRHLNSFPRKGTKICHILISFHRMMQRCATSLFLFAERRKDATHLYSFS